MPPKVKVAKAERPARKPNGIKGIKAADKSNDPLRDRILSTLRSSGIKSKVESKVVFAHTGIYIADKLFGWVGPNGFAVTCSRATQRTECINRGCTPEVSGNHKEGKYYNVPESLLVDGKKLRQLAEAIVGAAP